MNEHQVTAAEIADLSALGFSISIAGQQAAEVFVNVHFKGFDLLAFAGQIEKHLEPIAEETIVKNVKIVDEVPPKLVIQYFTANVADPDHRLLFSRTFTKERNKLIVKHDLLIFT
jgi:hypothetical protein